MILSSYFLLIFSNNGYRSSFFTVSPSPPGFSNNNASSGVVTPWHEMWRIFGSSASMLSKVSSFATSCRKAIYRFESRASALILISSSLNEIVWFGWSCLSSIFVTIGLANMNPTSIDWNFIYFLYCSYSCSSLNFVSKWATLVSSIYLLSFPFSFFSYLMRPSISIASTS